jgi:hypothetical protein
MTLLELNTFIDEKIKILLSKTKAKPIYLYNKDLTILYYTAISQIAVYRELGIVHEGIRKSLDGNTFLDFFRFTNNLETSSEKSTLSREELIKLIN